MNSQRLSDLISQVYVSLNLIPSIGDPKPLNRFRITQYFLNQEFCAREPFIKFYETLGVSCPSCQVYVPLNLNVKVKCLRKDISYTYNIFHGLNDRRRFLKPFMNMHL